MVDMYVLGDRFKRQKKTDSIFLVKTAISEIELLSEAVCFNTLLETNHVYSDRPFESRTKVEKSFIRFYVEECLFYNLLFEAKKCDIGLKKVLVSDAIK